MIKVIVTSLLVTLSALGIFVGLVMIFGRAAIMQILDYFNSEYDKGKPLSM